MNRNGLRRFSEQGYPSCELRLEFVSHVRRHFCQSNAVSFARNRENTIRSDQALIG